MLDNGLAAAEGAGHRRHAALGDGEERIHDALTGNHGLCGRQFLFIGTAATNRPCLEHGILRHVAVFVLDLVNRIQDGSLAAEHPLHGAFLAGRQHDLVQYGRGLLDHADDVAAHYMVADTHLGFKLPFLLAVQLGNLHAAGNTVARLFVQHVQRTLDAVEDTLDQPRGQFHGQRGTGGLHRLAGSQACCFFIYLNGGHVASQFDYLADQMLLADTDHVVQFYVAHAAGNDQRA